MKAETLLAGLSERLDIPAETLGSPLVSMTGRNMITVENHRGVTDCAQDSISILTPIGQIRMFGDDMTIKAMNRETIIICGRIDGMEWS